MKIATFRNMHEKYRDLIKKKMTILFSCIRKVSIWNSYGSFVIAVLVGLKRSSKKSAVYPTAKVSHLDMMSTFAK